MAFFLILSENNARHSTPWGHLVRYSTMTDPFDVLADSTRRDIVDLLRAPSPKPLEMSVGELVDALGITQPTVSKHLKVLRDSGLVQVREDGQHRYYRFDDAPLGVIRKWVGAQTAPEPVSTGDHSTSSRAWGRTFCRPRSAGARHGWPGEGFLGVSESFNPRSASLKAFTFAWAPP